MKRLFPKGNRRGIALLITLITVAMMMVLIATLLATLDSVRKDAKRTEAMLQANIYYADIAKIFKSFKKDDKKLLFETLYLAPIPFSSEDGSVTLNIACRPLLSGVNINWLALENDTKLRAQYDAAEDLFNNIVANYNLVDPGMLYEMLQEEMGTPGNRFVTSEQSRLMQKRGIISIQQLEQVLLHYQMQADDQAVSDVPWGKLFSFLPDATVIDANYMSAELIALLFNVELEAVEDVWIVGSEFSALIEELNVERRPALFGKEDDFLAAAECEVGYKYGEGHYRFAFSYVDEEVKHFEFYGRQ